MMMTITSRMMTIEDIMMMTNSCFRANILSPSSQFYNCSVLKHTLETLEKDASGMENCLFVRPEMPRKSYNAGLVRWSSLLCNLLVEEKLFAVEAIPVA